MRFDRPSLFLPLVILTALLAGCTTAPIAPTDERLLANPPPGWQMSYQFNNVSTRLTEFLPSNQTVTDWTEKLTFESDARLAGHDPIDVLMAEVKRNIATCHLVQHFNVFAGKENSYETATRLIMCGEKKARKAGEVLLLKAISGADYLYIISLVKKVEPFKINQPDFEKGEMAAWAAYLRRIQLCNPTTTDHPCPD